MSTRGRGRPSAVTGPAIPGTAWIYERLDALFAEAAARFETEVDPAFEDIQFVRYGVGAHFQTWHSDAGSRSL